MQFRAQSSHSFDDLHEHGFAHTNGNLDRASIGQLDLHGDAVSVTGRNFGSANSAKVGASPSSFTDSGMPS
jgi:hypothetical protein